MEKEKDSCTCHDDCTCGSTCQCTENDKCSTECTCEHECESTEECTCDHTCDCETDSGTTESEPVEMTEETAPPKSEKKKKGMFTKKDKTSEKVKELEAKIQSLEEKSLREKAELINFRRRKEEETSRMLKYANEDIVKELLPIIDNFERAIDMDDDNLEDEVSKFLAGFKMIYCNFNNTLEKYGVTEIKAMNAEFDPTIHQAVMTEHRDGVEAGMVIEVLQKGYQLKDKVIRPSMVKVSE